MTSCVDIECDGGCEIALPEVSFNLCDPEVSFGQISELYLTNIGYPLTDENDPIEWATRLALPANNPAKIIKLIGIGDKPLPEENVIEISNGREVTGPAKHTVNFRMDEVNDTNYEFSRNLQCAKSAKAWYKAYGGDAYGGPSGIDVSIRFRHVIPEGVNDLQTLPGVLTWKSKLDPCRFTHPLQGDES